MASRPMPEIPEAQATGEVAALYGALRDAFGVPVVNYIWRSLAAVDGLSWAWPRVRAWRHAIAAAAPRLRERAAAVARENGLLDGPALPAGREAMDVIRAYERGNSWNLLAVSQLRLARAGEDLPPAPVSPAEGGDRGGLAAIVPYPEHDRLPVAQREQIAWLSAAGPGRDSGVRPSLWVHLSPWPGTLSAVADSLPATLGSAGFGRAHARLLEQAPGLLGLGLPKAEAAGSGAGAADDAVMATLDAFRGRIAEMVLAGQVLAARAGEDALS